MNNSSHYKWLIVVEGDTDVSTYEELIVRYGVRNRDFKLVSAAGKGYVCNTSTWNAIQVPNSTSSLFDELQTNLGRPSFEGVVLIVDSDSDNVSAFDAYKRNTGFDYIETPQPTIVKETSFCHIDKIDGSRIIPIYGVNVPLQTDGCLETDLLASYGFPVVGQDMYTDMINIIKAASSHWQIPKKGDGNDWWAENEKAKLDKFIYAAFTQGFKVSRKSSTLPSEPDVIKNIRVAIGLI